MAKISAETLGLANKRRWQLSIIALLMLGLTYYSASRAIDTGSYWQYFMTIVGLYLTYRTVFLIFSNDRDK